MDENFLLDPTWAAFLAGVTLAAGVALGSGSKGSDGKEAEAQPEAAPTPVAREPEALYQKGKLAGRVVEAEVDEAGKEVRFTEIHNTDDLLLSDECEYQNYNLIVRKVAYAARIARDAPQKGRVLKGVVAEIVGYREH